MWHKFPYYVVPVDHGSAFPGVSTVMRPALEVTLRSPTGEERCLAIVDTGADYCLFPLSLVDRLGLQMKDARPVSDISGYGSNYDPDEEVLFWPVVLDIVPGLSISTVVGFSQRQEEVGWGLLGQLGFFNEVADVCFNYRAATFAIKVLDPAPPG